MQPKSEGTGLEPGSSFYQPYFLIVLCATLLVLAVGVFQATRPKNSYDFVAVYSGARCLLHGCNPYDSADLQREYVAGGGRLAELREWTSIVPVYPPSSFVVVAPVSLLPFRLACAVWAILNGSLYAAGTLLVWSICRKRRPAIAALLVVLVAYSFRVLLLNGQPASFAISATIIATILILRNQYVPFATVLFCLSAAVKPQLAAVPLLFLFIARLRRVHLVAAAAGAALILLGGATILYESPASAHWPANLKANIADTLQPGHINDPKSASGVEINLSSLTAVLPESETTGRVLSSVSSLCLAALWVLLAVRLRGEGSELNLSLAAGCVISLLIIYHRNYDAALLLLSVPGLLEVLERRKRLGLFMALLTFTATVPGSQDLNRWLSLHKPDLLAHLVQNHLLLVLLFRQQNVELLVLTVLYLYCMWNAAGRTSAGRQLWMPRRVSASDRSDAMTQESA